MIGVSSLELNGIIKRRYCKKQLQDMPSQELEDLARDILEKNKGRTVDPLYLAFAGTYGDLFLASGACDVLRERHGKEYIERLTGFRKPKTIGELLKYWVTGQMPKYQK